MFPQKGDLPVTAQISGSDLDGDLYFISWEDRLLPPNIIPPFDYTPPKKPDRVKPIEEYEMLDFFIIYMNYESLGKVDNAHLALAD